MTLYRDISALPDTARHAFVAIGNFDGVHQGHAAVIAAAVEGAKKHGACAAVLTFEPHPRRFFVPGSAPLRLTRFTEKCRLFAALGVQDVFVLRFNRTLSEMTAGDFVHHILLNRLKVTGVVTGEDFTFGHNRTGNAEFLRAAGAEAGFSYTALPPVRMGGGACSSTRIRDYLAQGKLREANALLGHPYEWVGKVRHGDKRGRVLGFPTANIGMRGLFQPALGVYAAWLKSDAGGDWWPGVVNCGLRPTVGGAIPQIEAHALDWSGNLYGERLRVRPVAFLRAEQKFGSLGDLQTQIAADVAQAKALLAQHAQPV